jgi:hypothetical protein
VIGVNRLCDSIDLDAVILWGLSLEDDRGYVELTLVQPQTNVKDVHEA